MEVGKQEYRVDNNTESGRLEGWEHLSCKQLQVDTSQMQRSSITNVIQQIISLWIFCQTGANFVATVKFVYLHKSIVYRLNVDVLPGKIPITHCSAPFYIKLAICVPHGNEVTSQEACKIFKGVFKNHVRFLKESCKIFKGVFKNHVRFLKESCKILKSVCKILKRFM